MADISSNDEGFNGHAYKSAGHKVIMIKATEGLTYVNPLYAGWAHAAHAAGLAVAHYHFCRPEQADAGGQADHFWNAVKPHFLKGRDRLVFDLETGTPTSTDAYLAELDARVGELSPGAEPIGYTFLSYLNEAGGRLKLRSKAWLIAAWGALLEERGSLPGGQWLWGQQYTDGQFGPAPHSFAGVRGPGGGPCDGSVVNKRSINLIEQALGKAPVK
jgi:GH25 family lysozyme M1 (1,4-beta-N-acetylmuramidase)